jgi:AcrR family transcriptional regulator
MQKPTRSRLIDAAIRRFYRDGFRSVGLDQIIADVGISKTAFYKHFESKDDLMLATLESQNSLLQSAFQTIVREHGGPTPLGQLHALLDVVEHFISSEGFQGCYFINAAMEFPLPHEPAHIAAAQNRAEIEAFVCALATEAQADNPQALAQELCLIMEGAYITRHVTGSEHTIDVARRLARLAVEAHCSASV